MGNWSWQRRYKGCNSVNRAAIIFHARTFTEAAVMTRLASGSNVDRSQRVGNSKFISKSIRHKLFQCCGICLPTKTPDMLLAISPFYPVYPSIYTICFWDCSGCDYLVRKTINQTFAVKIRGIAYRGDVRARRNARLQFTWQAALTYRSGTRDWPTTPYHGVKTRGRQSAYPDCRADTIWSHAAF
jgi:hypothetical protein